MEKIIKFKECRYCPHVFVLLDGRGTCKEQGYKVIALDTIDEGCTLEDAPGQDEPWRCGKCGEIINELPCSNCGYAEAIT